MGSSQTTVQKADPWAPAQPFILEGLEDAGELYEKGGFRVDPYKGQRTADPTYASRTAMSGIMQNARAQNKNFATAQDTLNSIQTGGNAQTGAFGDAIGGAMNQKIDPRLTGDRLKREDALGDAVRHTMNRGTSAWADDQLRDVARGRPQYDGHLNDATKTGTTSEFRQGLRGAQNYDVSNRFDNATREAHLLKNTDDFRSAVRSGMRSGPAGAVDDAVGRSMAGGVSRHLERAVRAQGGNDKAFDKATRQAAGVDVSGAMGTALDQGTTQAFRRGISGALQGGEDPRLSQAIEAQGAGNDARFDQTIDQMTGDGYTDDMRDAMRRNVTESVMPALNSTFAGSGMTGSSLHQAHLAKAMASGMAPVEAQFMDRAQDRQFNAATAAQGAHETRLQRLMDAGGAAQQAGADAADRGLQAGIASQSAANDGRDRALSAYGAGTGAALNAAGMRQNAREADRMRAIDAGTAFESADLARNAQALDAARLAQNAGQQSLDNRFRAGQMSQDSSVTRAQLGVSAGQAFQDAQLQAARLGMDAGALSQNNLSADRARAMQAAQLYSSNQMNARDQQLRAAGMAQDTRNASLDRQLRAGGMMADDNLARANYNLNAGQAAQSAQQAITAQQLQAGGMSQDAMMANRDAAMRAAAMQPALSDASYNQYDRMNQVGMQRQAQTQARLNDRMNRHYEKENADTMAINNYLALTSGLGGQFSTQTGMQANNPGLLGVLGAGAQGLGMLGMAGLISDRRAKENIVRVGQMDNGLPVYVYTYKGDSTPQMGVMAQEVEQIAPEAVSTRPDGLKQVHYGVLAHV